MATVKQTPVITDFTAGEISPRLYGRIDQPVYYKGASLLQNYMPLPQGGFTKRPGTLFAGTAAATTGCRLFEMVISISLAYIVEFTNNKIRFWKVASGALATYVSGQDITSTYTTAELAAIQFAWSYPYLFVTHQNHAPAAIKLTGTDTFSLAALTMAGTPPALATATITSGSTAMSSISPTPGGSVSYLGYLITSPGIPRGTTVTAHTAGATSLTMSQAATSTFTGIGVTFYNQNTSATYSLFGSSGNYPRCCAVAFQRVWFANTTNAPLDVWVSAVGIFDTNGNVMMSEYDITTFNVVQPVVDTSTRLPTTTPPTYQLVVQAAALVGDSDAINITINSDVDDEILWIAPSLDLFVGTATGEWVIPASSTANNISASLVSRAGSAAVQASMVNGGCVMVGTFGRKIRQIGWKGIYNPYVEPTDLSFFSEHLFHPATVTAFDFVQNPEVTMWFLRSDGTVVACLIDQQMGVMGWWRYVTAGTVQSLCVVPGENRDAVYMAVSRNSGAFVSIEKLADPDWYDPSKSDGYANEQNCEYGDCATEHTSGSAVSTITVNAVFNGMTLEVFADGVDIGSAVPSAGTLTLPNSKTGKILHCGILFTAQMQTMKIEAAATYGTAQTKAKAIPNVRCRFWNTLDAQIGANATAVLPADLNSVVAPTMFSGDDTVPVDVDYTRAAQVVIQSTSLYPCTVTALVPEVLAGGTQ